jgi:hypothetical protein
MKIVILDSHPLTQDASAWAQLKAIGDVEVYDHSSDQQVRARARGRRGAHHEPCARDRRRDRAGALAAFDCGQLCQASTPIGMADSFVGIPVAYSSACSQTRRLPPSGASSFQQ